MTTATAYLMTKLQELEDAQVSFAFDLLLFLTSGYQALILYVHYALATLPPCLPLPPPSPLSPLPPPLSLPRSRSLSQVAREKQHKEEIERIRAEMAPRPPIIIDAPWPVFVFAEIFFVLRWRPDLM